MTELDEKIAKLVADLPAVELTIMDLNEVARIAAGRYVNLNPNRTIKGEKLTSETIRTILWVEGVISVLSAKGLLPRKAVVKFDEDFVIESVFDD